jgi:hypothetical protein
MFREDKFSLLLNLQFRYRINSSPPPREDKIKYNFTCEFSPISTRVSVKHNTHESYVYLKWVPIK